MRNDVGARLQAGGSTESLTRYSGRCPLRQPGFLTVSYGYGYGPLAAKFRGEAVEIIYG